MTKTLKNLFRSFRKQKKNDLTRRELVVKASQGSSYAIRRYHGALDKLAEYDRTK